MSDSEDTVEEASKLVNESVPPSDPPQDDDMADNSERSGNDPPATGADPPAEDPPITESVHAHADYPTDTDGEDIVEDEEIIEEEVITDGDETIEEEVIDEEYTEGTRETEPSPPEETPLSASAAPAETQPPVASYQEPPATQSSSPGADAVSPMTARKEPVLDSDLARFMERRRQATDGSGAPMTLDDEKTEVTEPMSNIPSQHKKIDEPSESDPEAEASSRAAPVPEETEETEPESRAVVPPAAAGAAAGAALGAGAMYYASQRDEDDGPASGEYEEMDEDEDEDIEPVLDDEIHEDEYDAVEEEEPDLEDEPPSASSPMQAYVPQDQQNPYQQSSLYQQPNPYQQQRSTTAPPVPTSDSQPVDLDLESGDDDAEQPRDAAEAKSREVERSSSGPTWGLLGLCCCIALLLIGGALILGAWLLDIGDDDDGEARGTDIRTLPPIGSPVPTPPPTFPLPTSTPTLAPITLIPMEPGETLSGPPDSGFGASIAFSGVRLSVGAPEIEGAGGVINYVEDEGTLALIDGISGSNEGSEFGFSLDMNSQNGLIVGSPEANAPGRSIATGSAAYYSYNPGEGSWILQGGAFQGGLLRENVGERFGEAVAISSSTERAVVGAPQFADGTGRVYMFELSGGAWTPMDQQELLGRSGGAALGSSVDISEDGSVIAVGSPGDDGFHIYEWLQGKWTRTLREEGPVNSGMGTSVAVLSNSYVAVGMPSAQSNRGSIQIYEKLDGLWTLMDDVLVGESGEQIGRKGSLAGSVSPNGDLEVTFATATGLVRRFDFISGRWGERFRITTGLDISSLAVNKNFGPITVWVGSRATGEIAEFKQAITPSPTRPLTPEPTVRPTSAPTLSPMPTSSTKAPTATPTNAPTRIPLGSGWTVFSGPFSGPVPGIGFGAAVTVDGTLAAVSAPRFSNGVGAVQTYQKVGTSWEQAMDTVFDFDARGFGEAIDLSVGSERTSMVVGAPNTLDDQGFDLSFGSVYYYEMDGASWTQVGGPLRPPITTFASNGEFGSSVAVSADSQRVAVGGPSISLDENNIDNGRVFTYAVDGSSIAPLGNPIDGPAPGDRFGHAVAMSKDGSRLLVGAPGPEGSSAGAIYLLSWNGSQWQILLPVPGSTAGENFGTSVAIIADDGNTIAMGAPGFDGGRGAVRVYRRRSGSEPFWDKLSEDDIVGEPGDGLGTTLSGFNNRVVAGTASGSFKVYDYSSTSSTWSQVDEAPEVQSTIASIGTGSTGDVLVGFESDEAAFYSLF